MIKNGLMAEFEGGQDNVDPDCLLIGLMLQ
jgi:hypothetical protein